ncbi:HEAT repeat domain-containing protein [bacterium]|nr:HEAT repeat domain-containing protein [bacterium]
MRKILLLIFAVFFSLFSEENLIGLESPKTQVSQSVQESNQYKENLPKFKTLKIQVFQSYEGPAQGVYIPFKEVASRLFSFAGVTVVPDDSLNYEALLTIKVEGKALGKNYVKGGYLYTGARMQGEVSLEVGGKLVREQVKINVEPWEVSPYEYTKWVDPEIYKDPGRALASYAFGYGESKTEEGTEPPPEMKEAGVGIKLAKICYRFFGVKPLLLALTDKEQTISMIAGMGIASVKDPEAVLPLCEMLKSRGKEDNMRTTLIYLLGELGDIRAEDVLLEALKSEENETIKYYLIEALGKVKSRKAVEPLLSLLKEEKTPSEQKMVIIESLGNIGDERAIEEISKYLNIVETGLRFTAIKALGKIHSSRSAEVLVSYINDKDINIAYEARQALWRMGAEAIPVLFRELKRDKGISEGIAEIFDKGIKDINAIPYLLSFLKDDDRMVREFAVAGLVSIGRPSIEPLISFLEKEKDRTALGCAASALRAITKQDFGIDPAKWRQWWKENKGK